jgi:glycosyltransferase involved in cell wall biosynthesis
MLNQPLVSIIIPTFNRGHLIGETLDSVLAQTYTNWECIVVDDGSIDDTSVLMESYCAKDSRFQYHLRPLDRPKGANACRNYGLKISKGGYVVFFDSDDLMTKEMIFSRVVNIRESKVDMLISNALMFSDVCGDKNILWNTFDSKEVNIDLILRFLNLDMPWCTNGVTWSRAFLLHIEGWDETLSGWQDWELHVRALFFNPTLEFSNLHYDSYFRFDPKHESIGRLNRSKQYLKSVEKAVLKTEEKLKKHPLIYKKVHTDFEKLIFVVFIKFQVVSGFNFEPLKYCLKQPFFMGVKRFLFIKFYLIELLCKSYKIKTFILKNMYQQHILKTKMRTSHMRALIKDA